MKSLLMDVETYSSVNLASSGVFRYAEAPDFEILLFGYSVDGGKATVIDLANGEKIPTDIIVALTDENVEKWSFNAHFERICMSRWLRDNVDGAFTGYSIPQDTVSEYLNPRSWRCSMIWSAYMGLPLSLEGVGAVLKLEEQKLSEGKDLIRYFCQPCKPTKTNDGRTRNYPSDAPEKWAAFKAYNIRDVEVEIAIQQKLAKFPVPENIWEEYWLDQEINDRGVQVDMPLVHNAISADQQSRTELLRLMREITELDNPNSVAQIREWLGENGLDTATLGKKAVVELLKTVPEPFRRVLELRQSLAKSSVKKYTAMENAVCADGRTRGMFQFYGANRTGRWAGRLIQLQNLPQTHMENIGLARELVRTGNFAALETLYDSVPEVLSELIRTAFVPKDGYKFIVSDFSAIEARVIAWLAGEQWRNEVFATHGKIYEASASQMFRVPVEEITKGSPLRQKGKIAELALGYGGSVGALKAMGALEMGLTEDELQPLVTAWRAANPNIVKLWWDVDHAAIKAVREKTYAEIHGIRFMVQSGMLFITLPSSRKLVYVKPRIGINQYDSDCVTYEGVGGTKKWERIESYGPKFVENIVQAISRDILCCAMQTLRNCFIVMTVHDEIVIEADMRMSVKAVCDQMSLTPPWAKGLLLRADGYECDFYQKD